MTPSSPASRALRVGQHEHVARRHVHRLDEPGNPDLRATEVGEHGDRPPQPALRQPNGGEALEVLVVRAMREVQSRDVHARHGQLEDRLRIGRRRAERADDLRPPDARPQS